MAQITACLARFKLYPLIARLSRILVNSLRCFSACSCPLNVVRVIDFIVRSVFTNHSDRLFVCFGYRWGTCRRFAKRFCDWDLFIFLLCEVCIVYDVNEMLLIQIQNFFIIICVMWVREIWFIYCRNVI